MSDNIHAHTHNNFFRKGPETPQKYYSKYFDHLDRSSMVFAARLENSAEFHQARLDGIIRVKITLNNNMDIIESFIKM